MNTLQELLFALPFNEIHPVTPVGRDPVLYDVMKRDPYGAAAGERVLLYLSYIGNERKRLTADDVLKLMQVSAVIGILIYHPRELPIDQELSNVYDLFNVPVIHVTVPIKEDLLHGFSAAGTYRLLEDSRHLSLDDLKKRTGALQRAMNQPVTLIDETFKVISEEAALDLHDDWPRFLMSSRSKWLQTFYYRPDTFPDEVRNGTTPLTCYPVYVDGTVKGFVLTKATDVAWYHRLLDYYALLISLVMQEEEKLDEVNQSFKQHFMHDLLYNNFKQEQPLLEQARTWGWNLSGPQLLTVIRINPVPGASLEPGRLNEIQKTVMKTFRDQYSEGITEWFQEEIILIRGANCKESGYVTPMQIKDFVKKTVERFQTSDLDIQAGIGKCYEKPTELNKSYQEALMALNIGQEWSKETTVHHIDELGVLRLLFYLQHDQLTEFSQSYLQPLIASDSLHETEYIHTLKTWIMHETKVPETARALHVHPNTLRNRLQKMNSLLHMDLFNHEDFVNINIAVKIHTIDFFRSTVKKKS